jgi:hypothetical protein
MSNAASAKGSNYRKLDHDKFQHILDICKLWDRSNLADSDEAKIWQRCNHAHTHCKALASILYDLLPVTVVHDLLAVSGGERRRLLDVHEAKTAIVSDAVTAIETLPKKQQRAAVNGICQGIWSADNAASAGGTRAGAVISVPTARKAMRALVGLGILCQGRAKDEGCEGNHLVYRLADSRIGNFSLCPEVLGGLIWDEASARRRKSARCIASIRSI